MSEPLRISTYPARITWRAALIWLLAFLVTVVATAVAYDQSFPTFFDRAGMTLLMATNPAALVLFGEPVNLTVTGAFVFWRVGWFVAACMALWVGLSVIKLIRGEEEVGRSEALAAGIVSRQYLDVMVVTTLGAIALLISCVLSIAFMWTMPGDWGSAVAFGAALFAVSAWFLALGYLCSHVFSTRRSAALVLVVTFAIAYAIRSVADVLEWSWLHWITPLGQFTLVHPYYRSDWQPIVLLLAGSSVLFAGGFAVSRVRDFDAGLIRLNRPVRSHLIGLSSPYVLHGRLAFSTSVAWCIGLFASGVLVGSIQKSATQLMETSTAAQSMLEKLGKDFHNADFFTASLFGFFNLAIYLAVVFLWARMATDEEDGFLDVLFAGRWSRTSWYLGQLVSAFVIGIVLLFATAIGIFVGSALGDGSIGVLSVLRGAINLVAPLAALAGLFGALFAWVPRRALWLSAGYVSAAFLLNMLGALLLWPQAVLNLSMFEHIAPVPAEPFAPVATVIMLIVGAVGVFWGLWRFTRRDILG